MRELGWIGRNADGGELGVEDGGEEGVRQECAETLPVMGGERALAVREDGRVPEIEHVPKLLEAGTIFLGGDRAFEEAVDWTFRLEDGKEAEGGHEAAEIFLARTLGDVGCLEVCNAKEFPRYFARIDTVTGTEEPLACPFQQAVTAGYRVVVLAALGAALGIAPEVEKEMRCGGVGKK